MQIKHMTQEEGQKYLYETYDLELVLGWMSMSARIGAHDVDIHIMLSPDNSTWAVVVYHGPHGHLVDRINVPA